ncbi:MAG: glutamate--tRNA ligase [Myxococcota bacterium]
MTVRVRIGPSPTGEPHVGTAYIALFNLAFARQQGGQFVLRLEDTDQERSRAEWERQILEGLGWLGLTWDEGPDVGGPYGPYRQSERLDIYRAHVDQLLATGHAYRCFATKEELETLRAEQKAAGRSLGYDRRSRDLSETTIQAELAAGKPYVVRMKAPLEGKVLVEDRLRGPVEFDAAQVDDQILLKSDGYPTYHLANVVDDHLMEISHVIRAEEWISSTPKHVLLYQAFGWKPPIFIHMPLLRNADKSKISKRKNPVSLLDYRQRGFHPRAVVNFLAQLGFTMPDQRELFDFDEFVLALDWDRVILGGPTFDLDKFSWLNGKWFRERMSSEELTDFLRDELFSRDRIAALVPMMKERIDVGEQFIPGTDYFFRGEVELPIELLRPKRHGLAELAKVLETALEAFEHHTPFEAGSLEALGRQVAEEAGWKAGELFMPLRVALTGRKASPPLFNVMVVLGRALMRRRLRSAIDLAKATAKQEQRAAAKAKKKG